jgi:hypothetical protein
MVLALVGALVLGCSDKKEGTAPIASKVNGSTDFPAKDPGQPFAVKEKGTVTLTNDQAYEIEVQRENGDTLFRFSAKKGAVIEPSVEFTVQTLQANVPEELADQYVAVGVYTLEVHVVGETGYGFALKPTIEISFTDQDIEDAKQNGALLDTFKGNLIVLYKEQRSSRWVPQTSVSTDQEAKTVRVSTVAGAGSWRLAVRRTP